MPTGNYLQDKIDAANQRDADWAGGRVNGGDIANAAGQFFGFTPSDDNYRAAMAPNQNFWSDMAKGMATGTGPSIAQLQLQRGTDRNMQQAMALGASQRGYNPGMLRQIENQRAGIGQQMAGDSALLRLQEQLGAMHAGMGWDEASRQAQLATLKGQQAADANRMGFFNTLGQAGATFAGR